MRKNLCNCYGNKPMEENRIKPGGRLAFEILRNLKKMTSTVTVDQPGE
ncbi:MAG: hypothetical protein JXC33_12995 [Deltaproteobacteria bacterium]|nr:hypothetical protein [Deltaproteobacteria bacterium]